MIIFLNDRPIRLVGTKATTHFSDSGDRTPLHDYDQIIDARLEALKPELLRGHLLILNTTPALVAKLLTHLQSDTIDDLLSVTLACLNKNDCETAIKKPFKIIKAAGGVVIKNDKMLLIFRRGVWDLPKGKLDDGESSREGAAREVEEETGVRVAVGKRICTTWHTYKLNGNRILKRTKWYLMSVLDDRNMSPQEDEDIEQLAWLDQRQTKKALMNSFSSIRYVIEETNALTA